MTDRLFDFGQRVQDAVELPDFESLRGRGRRLVRTRLIAAAFAVAVVTAGSITVATSDAVDSDAPVVDVPLGQLTPEQVVQHPEAELESFAVDPGDRDVRAAVWLLPCEAVSDGDTGRLCNRARQALAVTDDGFASATYVGLPTSNEYPARAQQLGLQALGGGRFYVAEPYREGGIVDTAGRLTPITVSMRPAPLGDNEVFIEQELGFDLRGGSDAIGLDMEAALAHVLQIAPGSFGPVWQSPDGMLWHYNMERAQVVTSTDGGRTWRHPADVGPVGGQWVPSGTADMAALASDRGLFLRTTDGGRTWDETEGPSDILVYAHWTVVRPDGSLLMQAYDGQIYTSDGTDWTVATPAEPGLPDSVEWEYGSETYAHSVVAADGTQTVYVVGDSDQKVWASTDGTHWQETPAR